MGRRRRTDWTEDLIAKQSAQYRMYINRVLNGLCGVCGKEAEKATSGIYLTLCGGCRGQRKVRNQAYYQAKKGVTSDKTSG